MPTTQPKPDLLDILLRVGSFALTGFVVWIVASGLAFGLDSISRSVVAVLTAGLAANLLAARKFEQGRLTDFGLSWPPQRSAYGFLLGSGALGFLVLGAVLSSQATYVAAPVERSILPLICLLLAGVLGEELFFRGYAFQYLVREWNQPVTIAASGIVFGLVHLTNRHIQPLAAANTALWGCLLGYAYTRARSLWLPIGIHFGWNFASALFTSNLSGTTIRATGWELHWLAADLWSGGSYGLEGGLLATIVALPVWWLVRRMR